MFTGIVQGKATIRAMERKDAFTHLVVEFPQGALNQVSTGGSIALNGTCLTVVAHAGNIAEFDVIDETLRVTNLSDLDIDSEVNFERAARIGDEIGGHLLSGHIHTTAELIERFATNDNTRLTFRVDPVWMRYILPKGFVALNGASLTVSAETGVDSFSVHLIPETLAVTTFGNLLPGARVNLEVDSQTQTIVDTIERLQELKSAEKQEN